MKSSTYSSLVTIVFLQHKNDISKSIESVIRTTDHLCKKLNFRNDLSHMTKYKNHIRFDIIFHISITENKQNQEDSVIKKNP